MGKYHPDYDPNKPKPNWQNKTANQANVQAVPSTPPSVAQVPTPLPPGSVLKSILSNSAALQPTQTTVVATARLRLAPISMMPMAMFIKFPWLPPTVQPSLQPNLQAH